MPNNKRSQNATTMNIEETAALCSALRAEADSLQKRQRRKGIEYRFKEPMKRPQITAELMAGGSGGSGRDDAAAKAQGAGAAARGDSGLSSGSVLGSGGGKGKTGGGEAGEKTSVASGPSLMSAKGAAAAAATASGNKPGRGGPDMVSPTASAASAAAAKSAVMNLSDYDPKAVAQKEHDALLQQVTDLREEASNLRHQVEVAKASYEDLTMTLVQLSHEDDIELEQVEGVRQMEAETGRVRRLEAELRDAEAYQKTLQFMLSRHQKDKLTNLATLRAFEDALRVHKHELELQDNILRTVNKSRDAEVAELSKARVEVTKQLAALDVKLEARRVEVKARQEKARQRLYKMQVGLAVQPLLCVITS